jgi:glycosyltransferase involved in cell wall biosynthesis
MKASIIIPTFNACERLYYNLLSLKMQDYNKQEFEVIVVDNGSKDHTGEVLSALDLDLNLTIVSEQQNGSRGKARNLGIEKASGDIIIFSDSDMISDHDFVARHISEHNISNKVVCGTSWDKIYTYFYKDFKGKILNNFIATQTKFKQIHHILYLKDKDCLIGEKSIIDGSYKNYVFTQALKEQGYKRVLDIYGNEFSEYRFPWSFFITNNCSVRKENIMKAGMFDEGYEGWGCEDLDLGYRLYKNDCIFVKRDIKSVHQEHPTKSGDDGIKNIYRFTEKYDSAEILLFYFSHYTKIDHDSLNDIVRDLHQIEKKQEAFILTDALSDMLKILRDRELKMTTDHINLFHKVKNTKDYLHQNKQKLAAACRDIETKYGCYAFTSAFNKLSSQLFGIHIP